MTLSDKGIEFNQNLAVLPEFNIVNLPSDFDPHRLCRGASVYLNIHFFLLNFSHSPIFHGPVMLSLFRLLRKYLDRLFHPLEVGMDILESRLDLAVPEDLHHVGKPDAAAQSLGDHDRRGGMPGAVKNTG